MIAENFLMKYWIIYENLQFLSRNFFKNIHMKCCNLSGANIQLVIARKSVFELVRVYLQLHQTKPIWKYTVVKLSVKFVTRTCQNLLNYNISIFGDTVTVLNKYVVIKRLVVCSLSCCSQLEILTNFVPITSMFSILFCTGCNFLSTTW